MTRTDDIAATAGELHQLLQGLTPEGKAYLRTPGLTPKAPDDIRRLRMAYQLFCDGKLTADRLAHFVCRLCDADYGKGTNSCRSQAEIAAQRRCSVDTIQRADAALIKVGLATRKQARRSAAVFTMIKSEDLDKLFVQVGGEMPKGEATEANASVQADQEGTPKESHQGDQEAAPALRLQDGLRNRTQDAVSKNQEAANQQLRSRTSCAAQPYRDLKKKEARAQAHGRAADDPPIAANGAIRRWALSADPGWTKECRERYGPPPDSYDCGIYRLPKAEAQEALNAAFDYVKRIGRSADAMVHTRIHIIQRRINAMLDEEGSGAPS